jgi:hypothetical protein
MDDRFDHMLINESIRDNTSRVHYLPGSYSIVGQDGNRFNQSLTSPANSAVPSSVAIALYGMSDHLPVTTRLVFQPSVVSVENEIRGDFNWEVFPNPVYGVLNVKKLGTGLQKSCVIELLDVNGRVVYSENQQNSNSGGQSSLSVGSLQSGVYLLKIQEEGQLPVTRKIIKF